jgi:glycosyltransferase involved in cell wall biosynthesis
MANVVVSAIIRTNNSADLLPRITNKLLQQQGVDLRYIFVDDSSTDGTIEYASKLGVVIPYDRKIYNYSRALNLGIALAETEYTLIISSHTFLENTSSLLSAIKRLSTDNKLAAICFSGSSTGNISYKQVNSCSFNGWNGTWNTASIYRTSLLKAYTFREHVLSAEDQEWSRWALFEQSLLIEHIDGCGMRNLNPKINSRKKKLREWEFVSYYSFQDYLRLGFIRLQIRNGLHSLARGHFTDAFFNLTLASTLVRVRLFGVFSKTGAH